MFHRSPRMLLAGAAAGALSVAALATSSASGFVSVPGSPPGRCNGTATSAAGSETQTQLQLSWLGAFISGTQNPPECPSSSENVGFAPLTDSTTASSGEQAVNGWGATSGTISDTISRYLASDHAPTGTEIGNMIAAGGGGGQQVHTIPVAQTTVAIFVHLPANCTVPLQEKVTGHQLYGLWHGDYASWSAFFPDATGAGCTSAITRVTISSGSSTTEQLKDYLSQVVSPTDFSGQDASPTFPNATSTTSPIHSGADTSTGANVASYVKSNAGTAGYALLPDTIHAGISRHSQDGPFWLKVEAPLATGTFRDPQADDATQANCFHTSYYNVPTTLSDPTTGSWSNVISDWSATTDYPLCMLTYDIAWDSYSQAYSSPQIEANRFQTVSDVLRYITDPNHSSGGSFVAKTTGFTHVPSSLLGIANAGAFHIHWARNPPPGT